MDFIIRDIHSDILTFGHKTFVGFICGFICGIHLWIHMWDLRLKWPVYKAIWVISIINVVKSYLYMTSISSDPGKELLVL